MQHLQTCVRILKANLSWSRTWANFFRDNCRFIHDSTPT